MKQILPKATILFLSVCLISSSGIAKWPQKKPSTPPSQISKPISKPILKPTPKATPDKRKQKPKAGLKAKLKKDAKLRLDPRTGVLSLVGPNKNILAATRCSKGHCEGIEPKGGFLSYDFDKGKIKNFIFKDYLGKSHNVKAVYSRLGYHLILNGKRFGSLGWNAKSAFYEINWDALCWNCIQISISPGVDAPIDDPAYLGPACGNGRLESREACDYTDPNARVPAGHSCDTRCVLVPLPCQSIERPDCWFLCGNGVVDPGEECDFLSSPPLTCDSGCRSIPPPLLCYGCDGRGICAEAPGSFTDCGSFSVEPTCGGICPFGTAIPPSDGAIALCTLPVEERPADSQVREYDDYTLISQCQSDTSVRYTFCGREGDVTASVGECPAGNICTNGGCVEEPSSGPFCIDTDPDNDIHDSGVVVGFNIRNEAFFQNDYCAPTENADGTIDTMLRQYNCNVANDGTIYTVTPCPEGEHCESGACIPNRACIPSCDDTDPTNDIHEQGMANATDETCELIVWSDSCWGDQLHQPSCNSDNRLIFDTGRCPDTEICSFGRCVPACSPSCIDSDPTSDIFFWGTVTGVTARCSAIRSDDRCSDTTHVEQTFCRPDNGTSYSPPTLCPDGGRCSGGVCIPPSCTRTACELTPATVEDPGYITGINCVIQHDICDGSTVVTYICGPDGLPTEGSRIPCPNGCRIGADGLAIGLCNP